MAKPFFYGDGGKVAAAKTTMAAEGIKKPAYLRVIFDIWC